ncbi:MAG: hypothetical protein GY922_05010 [Proteobacteria bacterium]|nr:hypothetical protein [Pseudomonadota bacterium]
MKTGGTSFVDIVGANFLADRRYPDVSIADDADIFQRVEAYLFTPAIVATVNAMEGRLHMVRGHFPYAIRSLLDDEYVAMTILRHPVDRTISYLKHCRRYHVEHLGQDLEEIYEDHWFNETFIRDYQTKMFSLSTMEALAEDRLVDEPPPLPPRHKLRDDKGFVPAVETCRKRAPGRVSLECFAASTGIIQVDSNRLAIAKENLEKVEIVGVTEGYKRFLMKLVDQYGWKVKSLPHHHAGEKDHVSTDFRNRIARDNIFDMELYEYARALSFST